MSIKAEVELDVKTSGFESGLDGLKPKVRSWGRQMGSDLGSALGAHLKEGILPKLQGGLSFAAGVAGVAGLFGMSELLQQAVQADAQFRKLGTAIEWGTKQTRSHLDYMREAQTVAKRWGQDTMEIGHAMSGIFSEVGDAKFAVETMNDIGMAATASGRSVGEIAGLVGGMNEQFGITKDEVKDTLASIFELTSKGGASFEDVSGMMAQLGQAARAAGIEGKDGLLQLIGIANEMEGAAGGGARAMQTLMMVLQRLENAPALKKELKTKFKIDADKDQGMALLGKVMQLDQAQLGDLFGARMAPIIGSLREGGLDRGIAAAKTSLTGKDLEKKAADEAMSPEAQFRRAQNAIKESLMRPEVIGAMSKFAAVLPKLADAAAKLLDVIGNNPTAAVGIYAGLKTAQFGQGWGAQLDNLAKARGPVEELGTAAAGAGKGATEGTKGLHALSGGIGNLMAATGAAIAGVSAAVEQWNKLKVEAGPEGVENPLAAPGKIEADLEQQAALRAAQSGRAEEVQGANGERYMVAPSVDEQGNVTVGARFKQGKDGSYYMEDGSEAYQAAMLEAQRSGEGDVNGDVGMNAPAIQAAMRAEGRRYMFSKPGSEWMVKNYGGKITGPDGGIGQGAPMSQYLGSGGFDVHGNVITGAEGTWDRMKTMARDYAGGGAKTSGLAAAGGKTEVSSPDVVGVLRGGILVNLSPSSAGLIANAIQQNQPIAPPRAGWSGGE